MAREIRVQMNCGRRTARPEVRSKLGCLLLAGFVCAAKAAGASAADELLRISVYATAGDVMHYLAEPAGRQRVLETLRPLRVSRVFLEGRRGDEYVRPRVLAEVRD